MFAFVSAVLKFAQLAFECLGILLVIVDVKYVRNDMEMPACVYARAGRVIQLCLAIDGLDDSIALPSAVVVPRFIKGAPADY